HGLVRNLDYDSGFYGFFERDSGHVRHEIEMRSTTREPVVRAVKTFVVGRESEAFLVHLAEGTNAASREEFEFLRAQGLLTPKTAIIHGVALGAAELQAMREAGASLVWSPSSNVALYGRT